MGMGNAAAVPGNDLRLSIDKRRGPVYSITVILKSKDPRVKCWLDGELSAKRRALLLAVRVLHPASAVKTMEIIVIPSFFCPGRGQKGGFFMSKNHSAALFKSRLAMILCALFVALSIVLGKLLAINITTSFRLSFENLPILMAGMMFGPVAGAVVGVVADLVGCLIAGYTINPVITCGAMLVGLLSGLVYRKFSGNDKLAVFVSVFAGHIVGSMLVKSAGLHLWYGTPYSVLLLRIPIYLVTGLLESLILCLMQQNRAIGRYFKGADHFDL